MLGTFVECRIQGRQIRNVLKLPRDLIRANDTVWLMRNGALVVQPVDIVFRDVEYAFIREGLPARGRLTAGTRTGSVRVRT